MKKYLPLIITLLVIGFTALVSIPTSPYLLNGMTQADISNMYPTAITPATFTFSIWSVIYFSWMVLGLALIFGKIRLTERQILIFCMSMILTAVWLVPWSYIWIGSAFLIMLGLLGTLWYLFSLVKKESYFLRATVELFMGWIHIATFANLAVWLASIGIDAENIYLGIAILALAFFATLFFQIRYRSFVVSLVYLWASLGIYMGQPSVALRWTLMAFVVGIIVAMFFSYQYRRLRAR